jgi:hypothetical protein
VPGCSTQQGTRYSIGTLNTTRVVPQSPRSPACLGAVSAGPGGLNPQAQQKAPIRLSGTGSDAQPETSCGLLRNGAHGQSAWPSGRVFERSGLPMPGAPAGAGAAGC